MQLKDQAAIVGASGLGAATARRLARRAPRSRSAISMPRSPKPSPPRSAQP